MARLSDFSLDDSSPATSPHADGTEAPEETSGSEAAEGKGSRTKTKTAKVPAARLGTGLPDPKAKPSEQLVVCERAIHDAKVKWREAADKAMAAFLEEAGPYFVWVHENKLYKHLKDNNGKPYRSFNRYCQEQHGISRSSGYRITRVIPLLNILATADHPVSDLSSRQTQVLHPVRRQHGEDSVLKVWETAWSTKKGPVPSPDELSKAVTLCGLVVRAEDDEEEKPALTQASPGAEVEKAAKILVPDTVRLAVKEDPEKVLLLVKTLNAALEEAGITID
ncbi:hypothetical protein [Streptomyces chartreusis]|uniref:Uncharacterized protein n=1 Tax=Streptomyces chartreusis TaxID=1969 RepID=A0A7H8T519_STRCX|nr:hypothetical protein [Streptomyces chartreusis]QKZ18599.1 hypothetical protein HUT05_15205 [Streptomyces chartreusis]